MLPILVGSVLAILALLIDEIDKIPHTLVAQPAVVIVVVAPGAILLGQQKLIKADIGIGRRQVHFADGFGGITRLAQHLGKGRQSRRQRAVVAAA